MHSLYVLYDAYTKGARCRRALYIVAAAGQTLSGRIYERLLPVLIYDFFLVVVVYV